MNDSSFTWLAPVLVACALGCGSTKTSPSQVGEAGASSSGGNESTGAAGSAMSSAASGGLDLGNIDSGSAGAGGVDAAVCGGTTLAASPKVVNVLLVVDKSSSMTATPMGFGDTKWNGLRSALSSALDATSGKVAFGLDFFPSSGRLLYQGSWRRAQGRALRASRN